jgi:hypothetical protein
MSEYDQQPVDPEAPEEPVDEEENEGKKYDGGPIPRTSDSEQDVNE